MSEPPFDLDRAHKWFAVEWNNCCWDALEADPSSLAEDARCLALHRAHGAVAHWRAVGSEVNWVRALYLVTFVEAAFGSPEAAARFGQSCLSKADGLEGLADWDHAFIADSMAEAIAAALRSEQSRGNADPARCSQLQTQHDEQLETARKLGEAIVDDEDRSFFQTWFGRQR